MIYDIRVVKHPNRWLRALANLYMFKHNKACYDPTREVNWMQFRGGETEHRETANLAARMGGVELPPRHAFVKERSI